MPVGVVGGFDEEPFDAALGGGAGDVESGGEDAGVVEDEKIGGVEEVGEVAGVAVFDGIGLEVDDHEAGVITLVGGVLGDEVLGQGVIKKIEFHGRA